jgi:hypothetical protein
LNSRQTVSVSPDSQYEDGDAGARVGAAAVDEGGVVEEE